MLRAARFGGVNAAALTPMRPDLTVDLDRMAAHCRWLLANGCTGLAVLGTTGEANSLGLEERLAVIEGLVARGIPTARMLPGCGTPAIPDTVMLTRRAGALGCPGVLLLPPFFYKNPSDEGLFAYFSEVIQRTGGTPSVYLYHFPQQSAVPFGLDLIARLLAAYPGVIAGIKDSSADLANTLAYVEHFAADGFEVYCGDDGALQRLLKAGGAGCITAVSNVAAFLAARICADPVAPAADAAQATLASVRRAITAGPLIPGLKALLARHSGLAGWASVRPPHLPLAPEAAARLFAAFDACGVALPPLSGEAAGPG